MKNLITLAGVFSVLLFSSSVSALSKNDIGFKCYVEYAGGGDGIELIHTEPSKLPKILEDLLSGKANAVRRGKKVFVLKVKECVKAKESFKLGRAQTLDKKTLR